MSLKVILVYGTALKDLRLELGNAAKFSETEI